MVDPVSQEEEEFTLGVGAPLKSKYDFEGEFEIEFTEFQKTVAKSGAPMVKITVVGLEGPAEGLQFTDYAVSVPVEGTEGTLDNFRLREIKEALGDATPRSEPLKVKLASLVGQRVVAKFAREEYPKGSGKFNAKVKRYLKHKSATEGSPVPF